MVFVAFCADQKLRLLGQMIPVQGIVYHAILGAIPDYVPRGPASYHGRQFARVQIVGSPFGGRLS